LGYIHRGEPLKMGTGGEFRPDRGAFRVQAFKEKPDKATADRYVESGRYYWNSGMFVWRCDTVLSELAAHLPEAHKGLAEIAAASPSVLSDMTAGHTRHATLVCPKEEAQRVKELVGKVKEKFGKKFQ